MRNKTSLPSGRHILAGGYCRLMLILILSPLAGAGQIATWEFDGASLAATYTEPGLQGAAAVAGTGVIVPAVTTACTGFAWQGAGFDKNNRISALNTHDYVEFRLTTAANRQATIRTIFFAANSAAGSPAGPNQASIRINDVWVEMNGSSIFTLSRGSTCPAYGVVADTPVALPPNATATIRIYAWGADADGLLRIDDVFVFGSVALPIDLTAFTGDVIDSAIRLTWNTATEQNNDYMAVERSRDGRVFDEIGRVPGRGTTGAPQRYEFIDGAPLPGLNYYRLRQVDYDGTAEYHPVISVMYQGLSKPGVSAFPNPAGDELTIEWTTPHSPPEGEEKGILLQLFDPGGRLLTQYPATGSNGVLNIPVTDLPAGLYFIQLSRGRQSEVVRVVKE